MIWPYKLGAISALFLAAASSGFFYGQNFERAIIVKKSALAYQTAAEIQNEVTGYSDYSLCLAIGGVPDQCTIFIPGLGQAASD